jgi:hypothetical protein
MFIWFMFETSFHSLRFIFADLTFSFSIRSIFPVLELWDDQNWQNKKHANKFGGASHRHYHWRRKWEGERIVAAV